MERPGRDDLIEDVKYGRMSPADAEAKAARLGLEPFASNPNPQKFRPMVEAGWTLPMTIAWIAWRDPGHVLDCFDPYRAECFDWHYRQWRLGFDGPIYKGHFLEERRRATLSLLSLAECYETATDPVGQSRARVRDAIAQLWCELQSNALQATGIQDYGDARKQIPSYEWHDLVALEERDRDVVRYDRLSTKGYNDIILSRESVMALWPEKRLSESDVQLPPTVRPDGPGYFPLYCAVQWIATHGGSRLFDANDTTIWQIAYKELGDRIASSHVSVIGVRNGLPEKIEAHIFSLSLKVDYPFSDASTDLILSDELYLSSYVYLDDEHWHNGFDDSLRTRRGVEWSKLTVLKSDVAKYWPFAIEAQQQDVSPGFRTGAPGRPTPMHLVVAEHLARVTSSKAEVGVVAESEWLANWLKKTHPHLPPLTPKTIRNKISATHRTAGQSPK